MNTRTSLSITSFLLLLIVSGASLTATAQPQPSFMLITNAGIRTALFGFTISGSSNLVTVVGEACTNLTQPIWSPVFTNTLTNGPVYVSDPRWTNYPNRLYRLRSPRIWTRGDGWFVIGDSLSANVQSNGFSNSWFQQLTNYSQYSNQVSALNCAYGATDAFNASNAAISCVIPAKTTGSNLCFA